jgi:hypothetical protein
MTTLEARSGEVFLREPFIEVDAIDGSGNYRFVTNPNDLRNRAVRESVPGYRPPLEITIRQHMLDDLLVRLVRFPDNKGSVSQASHSLRVWQGGNGHILLITPNGEGNELSQFIMSSREYSRQSDGHLLVEDIEMLHGQQIVSSGRDGSISVNLTGSSSELYPEAKSAWRGFVDVTGNNPGVLVREAIAVVNQQKKELDLLLWKQRE